MRLVRIRIAAWADVINRHPLGLAVRKLQHIAGRTIGHAVGVPDYDAYVSHRHRAHPGDPMMNREQFYRNRQCARYAGLRGRCC